MLLASLVGGESVSSQLPVVAYAQPPMVRLPTVSPDGNYIAAVLNTEEGQAIAVGRFGTAEITPVVRLESGGDRVESIRWADNDCLLISISELITQADANKAVRSYYVAARQLDRELERKEDRMYFTGANRLGRLYQVQKDGSGRKPLWRRQARPLSWAVRSHSDSHLVSMLPGEPDKVLLQLYAEWDDSVAVFDYELSTDRSRKVFANDFGVDQWVANTDGQVVFGWQRKSDGLTAWYRPGPDKDWTPNKLHDGLAAADIEVASISGEKAYVLSNYQTGRQALWTFNMATAELAEVVYAVDGYDVEDAIVAPGDGRLLGVSWFSHVEEQHFVDADAARTAALVRNSFPGRQTRIRSRSADGSRLIVETESATDVPQYFSLDLEAKTGAAWYATYPKLAGETLAPTRAIEFEARDGTRIGGYLTMPAADGDGKPPLLVYPHDGPHERDVNRFDPFVQFFASRGFAVLQVNFRGSSGFGSAFEAAGYREWGGAMQQDVYDGINWVVSEGLADGGRKCIVGHGYGGYVALTAAYQRPFEYQCVVSINGIADALAHAGREGFIPANRQAVARRLGSPYDADDRERLRQNSPVSHADNIAAPVLLIHGTHNARVPASQSRDFNEAAMRWGADVEYLELEGATHFLDDYTHRVAVFETLEGFLRKHL